MRKRNSAVVGSLILSLLICWLPVSGDILHLRDGRQIEGTVTETTEATVTIITESGEREYPVSLVDFIERTDSGESPELEAVGESSISAEVENPDSHLVANFRIRGQLRRAHRRHQAGVYRVNANAVRGKLHGRRLGVDRKHAAAGLEQPFTDDRHGRRGFGAVNGDAHNL